MEIKYLSSVKNETCGNKATAEENHLIIDYVSWNLVYAKYNFNLAM